MQRQVDQLALNTGLKDKANFKTALGLLNSKLGTFAPGPTGILGKAKSRQWHYRETEKFQAQTAVFRTVVEDWQLVQTRENSGTKAKGLVDKTKGLTDKFNKLVQQANDLSNEIVKRTAAIDALEKVRQQLARKQ